MRFIPYTLATACGLTMLLVEPGPHAMATIASVAIIAATLWVDAIATAIKRRRSR